MFQLQDQTFIVTVTAYFLAAAAHKKMPLDKYLLIEQFCVMLF